MAKAKFTSRKQAIKYLKSLSDAEFKSCKIFLEPAIDDIVDEVTETVSRCESLLNEKNPQELSERVEYYVDKHENIAIKAFGRKNGRNKFIVSVVKEMYKHKYFVFEGKSSGKTLIQELSKLLDLRYGDNSEPNVETTVRYFYEEKE